MNTEMIDIIESNAADMVALNAEIEAESTEAFFASLAHAKTVLADADSAHFMRIEAMLSIVRAYLSYDEIDVERAEELLAEEEDVLGAMPTRHLRLVEFLRERRDREQGKPNPIKTEIEAAMETLAAAVDAAHYAVLDARDVLANICEEL